MSLTASCINQVVLCKAHDYLESIRSLPSVDTGGYGSTTGERRFAYGQAWLWANLDGYWAWFAQSFALRHIHFDPAEVESWVKEMVAWQRGTGGVAYIPSEFSTDW